MPFEVGRNYLPHGGRSWGLGLRETTEDWAHAVIWNRTAGLARKGGKKAEPNTMARSVVLGQNKWQLCESLF
jgi:hypothetical protein